MKCGRLNRPQTNLQLRKKPKMSTIRMRQIVFGIPEFANKTSQDLVKYLLRLISRMEHLTLLNPQIFFLLKF